MLGGSYKPGYVSNPAMPQLGPDSTFMRTNALPYSHPSIDVQLDFSLAEALANPSAVTWRPTPGSTYTNALLDRNSKGLPVGDLRKAMLHSMEYSLATTNFPSALNFSIEGMRGKHITSTGAQISGTVLPGCVLMNQPIFTRPPTVVTEALISLMNLDEQAVEESFVTYKEADGTERFWVKKGTSAALKAIEPEMVAQAHANQRTEWISRGNSPHEFVAHSPYSVSDTQPYIEMASSYWTTVKEETLKVAREQKREASVFYTNLANLKVMFMPPQGTWQEAISKIVAGKAPSIVEGIMNQRFFVSMKLVPAYTLCSGEVWDETVEKMRKVQIVNSAQLCLPSTVPLLNAPTRLPFN